MADISRNSISQPQFQLYDMETWERAEYFHYYMDLIKTRYNLNVNIDITGFMQVLKEKNLKFFPSMLYIVMRTVNTFREFRTCLDREGRPGYWNFCNPSYTVFHKDTHTFSDIWSPYSEDFHTFYETVVADIARYGDMKGVKGRGDRPENFVPVSSLPWLSFTGYGCDTYSDSRMILPIILFGKHFEQNGRMLLPFSISVNHATADGYHSSLFLNTIQKNCDEFAGE